MKTDALYLTGQKTVDVRTIHLDEPAPHQVLVQATHSAISAGTEMLFYRGGIPAGTALDIHLPALGGKVQYPLQYGYSITGVVIEAGEDVPQEWQGRLIFAFHPHQSRFLADPADLIPIPEGVSPEDALFLPNMETAITLAMDGDPSMGEDVVVFGQGVVGLLTTAVLSAWNAGRIITLDPYELRRKASLGFGADYACDPADEASLGEIRSLLSEDGDTGSPDLIYELSGNADALNRAIRSAGFETRIIVGSWYGEEAVPVRLNTHFHRSRISIISSQVSTIGSAHKDRWTRESRRTHALERLRELHPAHLITHRFPVNDAAGAYEILDDNSGDVLQVVLTY